MVHPNTKLPIILGTVAVTMLAAAFASKPLYDSFCRVTGFGGTIQRADTGAAEILDRTITVRFDANVARGVPVEFVPEQTSQTLQVGATGMAYYRATNLSDAPVAITATFNVTPFKTGPYFRKLECFCFTEQILDPGETIDMPVVYFVHPAIADDERLDDVSTITLSYTFFVSGDGQAGDVAANSEPARGAVSEREG